MYVFRWIQLLWEGHAMGSDRICPARWPTQDSSAEHGRLIKGYARKAAGCMNVESSGEIPCPAFPMLLWCLASAGCHEELTGSQHRWLGLSPMAVLSRQQQFEKSSWQAAGALMHDCDEPGYCLRCTLQWICEAVALGEPRRVAGPRQFGAEWAP